MVRMPCYSSDRAGGHGVIVVLRLLRQALIAPVSMAGSTCCSRQSCWTHGARNKHCMACT